MKDTIETAVCILMMIGFVILSIAFYVCAFAIALSPFVLVAWLCAKLFT